LIQTGHRIDSSVASQRFDFFLSFGSLNKLNWLTAPRRPYRVEEGNIFNLLSVIGYRLFVFPDNH
jgi:hypothetical protein